MLSAVACVGIKPSTAGFSDFSFLFFLKKISLFILEREQEQEGQREREREIQADSL